MESNLPMEDFRSRETPSFIGSPERRAIPDLSGPGVIASTKSSGTFGSWTGALEE
jgi:hypothetical protein